MMKLWLGSIGEAVDLVSAIITCGTYLDCGGKVLRDAVFVVIPFEPESGVVPRRRSPDQLSKKTFTR